MTKKECFKCLEVKEISDFYKHHRMGDGHMNKCKECTKKDVREHRYKNLEKIRSYDRERGKNPDRIKLATEVTRRWRAEDSRRCICHSKVARAIRSGELERLPCERCGCESSMAHHESYDRPLDVTWLCSIHHKERHKEMAIQGIEP